MISVASTSIVNRSGRAVQLPEPLARPRVRRAQRVQQRPASTRSGRSPETRSSPTPPARTAPPDRAPRRGPTRTRRRRRASPPDRGSPGPGHDRAGAASSPASRSDSARVSPSLSATCASSALPACDTKPAPSAVTSTVTGRPSRITFKVNLQARDSGPSASPRIPAQPDDSAPPHPGGAGRYCTIRASRGRPAKARPNSPNVSLTSRRPTRLVVRRVPRRSLRPA